MNQPPAASQPLSAREALALGTERLRRAGVESASLDMSLILTDALRVDRLHLYLDLDRVLSEAQRDAARAMLARRIKREPLAYILGRREFYGLDFEVTPAVLIPRPETELLVERAVDWIKSRAAVAPEPMLADIGTGSGAIAVAAAHACPTGRWIAIDNSNPALEVARRNAAKHGVADRIDFRSGSLFESIDEPLEAIVSNPPYVAETERAELAPEVAQYEPSAALFAGEDGLDVIRALIAGAPDRLKPDGLLLLECGAGQAATILALLQTGGRFGQIRAHRDLANVERVIEAALKGN